MEALWKKTVKECRKPLGVLGLLVGLSNLSSIRLGQPNLAHLDPN